jgi:hypothetical protein
VIAFVELAERFSVSKTLPIPVILQANLSYLVLWLFRRFCGSKNIPNILLPYRLNFLNRQILFNGHFLTDLIPAREERTVSRVP